MRVLHPNGLLLCLMFIFISQVVDAQNAISEKIAQNLTQIQSTKLYRPLEMVAADELKNRITDDVLSRKQFFKIQNQAVQTIKNNNSEYLRITIPLNGEDTELELVKAQIFTDDFRTVATSNPSATLDIDIGIHYRGTVKGTEKSLAVISFFDHQMMALVQVNDEQYTLGKVPDSDYHILYKNSDLNFTPDFSCEAIPWRKGNTISEIAPVEKSMMGCVRIHVEVDYSLYQDLGSSIIATTNYVNGVFAEVATMYANESISIQVSFIRVWDTPSPYNSGTELDDLTAQGYGRTSGDLVHLVYNDGGGGGGLAYLNVLCSSTTNTGVSSVFGAYNNVPTYSEDVAVITHELGHNFGSDHTHDCVWNGNNTQIDDCGSKYYDEDNDPDTQAEPCYDTNNQILPTSGTIMSYCHLLNNIGIDFNLGFGTQPGDLIRSRVNAATCLSACESPTCSDGYQNGDEEGIDCGGASCPVCPTCDDGIQNGNETDIDCGGSCPPCPCDANALTLTINFDNFPPETTWIIKDFLDIGVALGGPYNNEVPGSTLTEYLCLSNGCYDFIIRDAYGDGICCGFGDGSYSLADADGNILVSGGEFGNEEITNFCISSSGPGWETCDPVIDLGTETLSTGTVHAQDEVISAGTVPAQTNVSLKAGTTIHLESGFNVDTNADVEILIENCIVPVAVPD